MTDVFVAGPIDFKNFETILAYRTRIYSLLAEHGCTPIDQYSDAFEQLASADLGQANPLETIELDELPDEPYLDAISAAIAASSVEAVFGSPDIVPAHTPEAVVTEIVERDLELVEQADVFLAYLQEPSCGTMVELLHATDHDIPTIAISDPPPHFVRYYADRIYPTIDDAIAELETP